jgi:UDP-glucose 4-epimerase
MVRQVVKQEVEVAYQPPRQGDIRQNYSAITKINHMLGWQPEVALADGLPESWQWFREWSAA